MTELLREYRDTKTWLNSFREYLSVKRQIGQEPITMAESWHERFVEEKLSRLKLEVGLLEWWLLSVGEDDLEWLPLD
ncbi:MAG: hypothetical protein AAGC43_18595, partial [Bacteroidota bacterium]